MALGPLLLAFCGWALAPWAWLVVPALVVAATEALTWSLEPGPERQLVRPAGWAGAIWLGWAWLASPLDPYVLLGLLGLSLLWLGLWWAYGRLLRQPGTSPVSKATGPIMERWSERMATLGLGGVEATVEGQTEDVLHLRLRLTSGRTVRSITERLDTLEVDMARELEGKFPLRPGAMRVEKDPTRAHICHLFVELRDPLRRVLPYQATTSERFADPARIMFDQEGEPVAVTIAGRHVMVAGRTGAGKSRLLELLILDLARPDVALLGIDVVKHGADFGPLKPVFHRLETTHEGARDLVRGLLRVREVRAQWLADQGLQDWPVSAERPQIVVPIDEMTGVIEALGGVKELNRLAHEGRQSGITLVMGTQRVTAEALGESVGLRQQCAVQFCLRVSEKRAGAAFFGDDRIAEGWRPDKLGEKGTVLVWSDGELELPTPLRTYDLPTETAARLASERAAFVGRLDQESRAALGGDGWRAPAQVVTPPALVPDEVAAAEDETAEALLQRLLDEAGEEGARTGELEAAVAALPDGARRGRAWTHARLKASADDAGHGRWRARRAAAEEIA